MSKKLIAIALAGLFAFSAVSVKADTLSDLQAIITSLTAQIAALQAQITGLSGGTTTVCFNTDLSQGMTSNDVKNLQIKLGVTPTSGYFGPITLAAVKTFQTAHGVINTGYVGPLTRASLNTLYCTPTTTTTIATGYPAGCTSAVGFSTTTGLSCAGTVSYPAGCTSTAGFSSTTGLSCATPVAATEGNLTVTQYPLPASGTVIVYGGNLNTEIVAYKLKATNSDIRVKRFLLQFGITNDFPWRALTSISIWDGTTLLKEVAVNATNFTEATFATTYTMTLDGLDVLVAKDTEKVLSIKVSALSVPQYTTPPSPPMTVFIPANGVRGIDSTGLNVYGPGVGLVAINFTTALAQIPTLTITAATDNPLTGNFIGNLTAVSRVDLLKINVKAEGIGMTFKSGLITLVTNTGNNTISTVELYDGATLLAATATSTAAPATYALSTYTLVVPAGTTKVLTFKGVVPAATAAGNTVRIDLPVNGLIGIDTNSAVNGGPATIVTGAALTHYLVAPTFALNSASVVRSNSTTSTINDVGDFAIGIKVTANGGDIYLPTVAHTTLGTATGTPEGFLPVINPGLGTPAAGTSSYWSCDSVAIESAVVNDFTWRIPSGATSVCTFNLHAVNTLVAGYYNVSIGNITWGTSVTDLNDGVNNINQITGLTALKAPATNLGI